MTRELAGGRCLDFDHIAAEQPQYDSANKDQFRFKGPSGRQSGNLMLSLRLAGFDPELTQLLRQVTLYRMRACTVGDPSFGVCGRRARTRLLSVSTSPDAIAATVGPSVGA